MTITWGWSKVYQITLQKISLPSMWNHLKFSLHIGVSLLSSNQNPCDIPLYGLVIRNPYSDWLWSLLKWVVKSLIYNSTIRVWGIHCSFEPRLALFGLDVLPISVCWMGCNHQVEMPNKIHDLSYIIHSTLYWCFKCPMLPFRNLEPSNFASELPKSTPLKQFLGAVFGLNGNLLPVIG